MALLGMVNKHHQSKSMICSCSSSMILLVKHLHAMKEEPLFYIMYLLCVISRSLILALAIATGFYQYLMTHLACKNGNFSPFPTYWPFIKTPKFQDLVIFVWTATTTITELQIYPLCMHMR